MARKRDFITTLFNRGLNLVRSRSQMDPGESERAENVVFTRQTVKRRGGKAAAYGQTIAGVFGTGPVTMIRRFYDLATTGTIAKHFVQTHKMAAGDADNVVRLWTTDWDDDSGTLVTAAITLATSSGGYPNDHNDDNTMYWRDGEGYYDAQDIAVSDNVRINDSFASKSWLYMWPTYESADDTDPSLNVPLRLGNVAHDTIATPKIFLHGLQPPNSLDQDDTIHDPGSASPTWSVTDVDLTNDVGNNADIVVDSSGFVHIVHRDITNTNIEYSTNESGSWVTSTIGSDDADAGTHVISLAISPTDELWVAYCDSTNNLKAAHKASGGDWVVEAVHSTNTYSACSIAVDGERGAHIAYYDQTNGQCLYATKASGASSWTLETIDTITSANVGNYPSIAIDSDGIPHVSYYDTTNSNLVYDNRKTDTWGNRVTVDNAADVGYETSIALDSNGDPGILYSGATTTDDLFYAKHNGSSWATVGEVIDNTAGGFNTFNHGLKFDSADIPTVVYHLVSSSVMNFGRRVSGSWETSQLSGVGFTDGNAGCNLFIDSSDDFHIAASQDDNDNLTYWFGNQPGYHYKLTAEYDDLKLGESGPSAATTVVIRSAITATNSHTIGLATNAASRYDMTDDVTAINVYRTIRDADVTSTYYYVGQSTCTAGVVGADFTDAVPDSTLVSNKILDEDKYFPPKFLYGTVWKDRAVIANLKCRDTSDDTKLDHEDGGIHKNRIRFSRAFTPDVFPTNYFIDILPDGDSGSIKGLLVNKKIDHLFVLMEADVVALSGDTVLGERGSPFRPRNIANAKGTPSGSTAVEADGIIFYWSKGGIEAIDSFQGRDITSETIAPLWNMQDASHPRYADRIHMDYIHLVRSLYDPKTQRIYWFYPSATLTYNDKVLVLDLDGWRRNRMRQGVFSILSGWNISAVSRWDGEGDRGEIFGGQSVISGKQAAVYRLDFGDSDESLEGDDATITSTGITAYLDTGLSDYGRPDVLKRFHSMRISGRSTGVSETTPTNQMTITLDVDDGKLSSSLGTTFSFDDASYREIMQISGLPRTAIGVRAGLDITAADAEGTGGDAGVFPRAFELYSMGMEVSSIPTRRRPHLA